MFSQNDYYKLRYKYLPTYCSEKMLVHAKQYLFDDFLKKELFYNRYPCDLSNCQYAALFAQQIFGGKIHGNKDHQFIIVNNNSLLMRFSR